MEENDSETQLSEKEKLKAIAKALNADEDDILEELSENPDSRNIIRNETLSKLRTMDKVGLSSKEYIASISIGDLSESHKQMLEIKKYLKNLYEKNLIIGFEYMVIKSESDIYDEDLDIDAIRKINQGIFPCIWINITYETNFFEKNEQTAIEEKFSLISL